jgi:adenylate cyclase
VKCGTDLPAGAKFCLECGQPVGVQPTVDSRFTSPASYTPKHLAEKILTSKSALEGERKQVTVLFAEHGFSRWLAQATFLQGRLLIEREQKEAGIAQMAEALARERAGIGLARWNALFAALLAEAYGKSGQTSEGLKIVNEELTNARVTECCCYQAELHRIKGELLLGKAAEDEQQAEASLGNALIIARDQSAKSLELRAAMSISRLWKKQGKLPEARDLLGEVYGWFTEGFDTADLKQAKALLDDFDK